MPARRCMVSLLLALALWPAAAHGQSAELTDAYKRSADLYSQGRYMEALPFAEQALELSEREFGPGHPRVATGLNTLAEVRRVLGGYAEAERLHRRALAIREKALGPDHPAVAQSLANLAGAVRAQGRVAKAQALLARARRAVEARAAAQDALWRDAMAAGGAAYQRGDYAGAGAQFEAAVAAAEAFGARDSRVATSLNALAKASHAAGNPAEAEELYKRAIDIWNDAFGPEHPAMAASLNQLALLYFSERRYAEAEPLYRRALAIDETFAGPDHPDVAAGLNNLARLLHVLREYGEAERLYLRSLAIYESAFGPDHPYVAVNLNNLAMLYHAQRRYAEAEPLYGRALAINRAALEPGHPQIAASLAYLAELYNDQGRAAEAESMARAAAGRGNAQAQVLLGELLGEGAPGIAPAAEVLAAAEPQAPVGHESNDASYVAVEDASVRAAPKPGGRRVAVLAAGDVVTALGRANRAQWIRVARDGKEIGYVWAPLLVPAH